MIIRYNFHGLQELANAVSKSKDFLQTAEYTFGGKKIETYLTRDGTSLELNAGLPDCISVEGFSRKTIERTVGRIRRLTHRMVINEL